MGSAAGPAARDWFSEWRWLQLPGRVRTPAGCMGVGRAPVIFRLCGHGNVAGVVQCVVSEWRGGRSVCG